jgi:hypothetical protein
MDAGRQLVPRVNRKMSEKREESRSSTVGSRRAEERRDRFKVGAHRLSTITERSGGRESAYHKREAMAHEKTARS